MTGTDWTEAECRGYDPEAWFPGMGESGSLARSICRRCPIQDACLDVALTLRIYEGIWGGLTPGERARLNPNPGQRPCKGCTTLIPVGKSLPHYCPPCRDAVRRHTATAYEQQVRQRARGAGSRKAS